MSAISSASTALLTEHLRWTPLSLIDDVINTINELLYQSVAAVETFMLSSPPHILGFTPAPGVIPDTDGDGNILLTEKEEEEINQGVHKLETLLEHGVDKNFDRFEIFVLRNVLAVPDGLAGWVRLAHHQNLDFSSLPSDSNPDPPAAADHQSRLRTLRQTLLASHALNTTLQSEVATNARALTQLRSLVSATTRPTSNTAEPLEKNPFSFLGPGVKEAKDAASFAVSQIHLIRELVQSLKPKHAALMQLKKEEIEKTAAVTGAAAAEEQDKMDIDDDSTKEEKSERSSDEERKLYIEKMTRRHMEASRGLRLNAKGEVVGGDFEGGGVARKGLEEVEGLEGVVEAMGGGAKNENET